MEKWLIVPILLRNRSLLRLAASGNLPLTA